MSIGGEIVEKRPADIVCRSHNSLRLGEASPLLKRQSTQLAQIALKRPSIPMKPSLAMKKARQSGGPFEA
jgi:hypothetical protein